MDTKEKCKFWKTLKFYVNELIKMYSGEYSFFSKKRVESGIAFFVGQFGMVYFLLENISKMTATDITLWAAVEFAIAGYMVGQIQKEKKENHQSE